MQSIKDICVIALVAPIGGGLIGVFSYELFILIAKIETFFNSDNIPMIYKFIVLGAALGMGSAIAVYLLKDKEIARIEKMRAINDIMQARKNIEEK